jgi:hypothetical protein
MSLTEDGIGRPSVLYLAAAGNEDAHRLALVDLVGIENQIVTVDIKNRHPLQALDLHTALLAYVSRKISQRLVRQDPVEVPDGGIWQMEF